MSGIPPTWLGSIIQGHGAQAHAAERKSRESATAADGAPNFADRLQDVIEETDRDSQVYSDAEGTGSMGRSFDQREGEPEPKDTAQDENANPGLDVQA